MCEKQNYILCDFDFRGVNAIDAIFKKYSEPHRFYHTLEHVYTMLRGVEAITYLSDFERKVLKLAILYHDVVYDPKRVDNELQSAQFMMDTFDEYIVDSKSTEFKEMKPVIYDLIISTALYKNNVKLTGLTKMLAKLDLASLNTFDSAIQSEELIFKEFQFVDNVIYRCNRIKFLHSIINNPYVNPSIISFLISYVSNRSRNIGVYAGSFNPFHKGHYNVLQKAETMFDKVIIAQGVNLEKDQSNVADITILPALKYKQTLQFGGLLTDFIKSLQYNVTIIRGLRNITDLQYETNFYRTIKDIMPELEMAFILCDPEFQHISSSTIRLLKNYNKDGIYLI
jgi:pantetheine-phosphate adenylyltransferase